MNLNSLELFGIITFLTIFIYILSLAFGFATKDQNRKAQGLDKRQ